MLTKQDSRGRVKSEQKYNEKFSYLIRTAVGDPTEHFDEAGGSGCARRRSVVIVVTHPQSLGVQATVSAGMPAAETTVRAAPLRVRIILVGAHAHAGQHRLREAAADERGGDHDGQRGGHVQVLVFRGEVLGLREASTSEGEQGSVCI